jgi:putative transcriptional regulator
MKSLQGYFLVASAKLLDPNFFHSVILVVQHDENGAIGLVLNQPTQTTIAQAWKQVSETPYENTSLVHQGGPCEGPLMVLHTRESSAQVDVLPGVYFSNQADSISSLVELEAQPLRFFVGYAGWQALQLESEIAESAWLVVPASAGQVFDPSADQWVALTRQAMRSTAVANIDPKLIPPDPSMN